MNWNFVGFHLVAWCLHGKVRRKICADTSTLLIFLSFMSASFCSINLFGIYGMYFNFSHSTILAPVNARSLWHWNRAPPCIVGRVFSNSYSIVFHCSSKKNKKNKIEYNKIRSGHLTNFTYLCHSCGSFVMLVVSLVIGFNGSIIIILLITIATICMPMSFFLTRLQFSCTCYLIMHIYLLYWWMIIVGPYLIFIGFGPLSFMTSEVGKKCQEKNLYTVNKASPTIEW